MSGPSQSKSSSSTDQSTKITETTTVTIDDVGLTGDAAVGVVEAITAGAVAQTAAIGQLLDRINSSNKNLFGPSKNKVNGTPAEATGEAGDLFPILLAAGGAIALLHGLSKK